MREGFRLLSPRLAGGLRVETASDFAQPLASTGLIR